MDTSTAPLIERLERVMAYLSTATASPCDACGRAICGHEALMSLAAGHQDTPLCLACLAGETRRPAAALRDELAGFVLRKECLSKGWAVAGAREGCDAAKPPRCLWPEGGALPAVAPGESRADAPAPRVAASWDAGDMGCGELVLELRTRLAALAAGDVFRLTTRDAGAPEDLPAWCRLTGNALVSAQHPDYFIQRRD